VNCRFCATALSDVFLDLGTAPPSNAFLSRDALQQPELWFPLKLFTCTECLLVQVDEIEDHARLFSPDYVYFSSISRSWLAHAERFVAEAIARLGLDSRSQVVEIASNDGYLLQYVLARHIPCFGVEPTASTARAARARGIETLEVFFGAGVARDLLADRGPADLVVANNVLAHVPDINDFVRGLSILVAPRGTITVEFPHLMELVANRQFDTVYHEHFSYFSFHTVCRIFAAHGLKVWDVERLATHGGSLRIWASPDSRSPEVDGNVGRLLRIEAENGMLDIRWYRRFQAAAEAVKNDFLAFLLRQKNAGKVVAGYGAAAKGNTLLNFSGVREDLVRFVADASPHKQGRFLPGSRIPVLSEESLRSARPEFIVVFPWNLRVEILHQLDYVRGWGGQFVFAVPRLETVSP
jgi:trans-aconitate methyltransferase